MTNDKACLSRGMRNVQENSLFGRYSDAEMIFRVKGIAMDPCNPQFVKENIQPLFNQILRLRKVTVLEDSEIPWRKRKREQFLRDKLLPPSEFIFPNQQNVSKLRTQCLSSASSQSCLLNSNDVILSHDRRSIFAGRTSSSLLTFDNNLPMKQVSTKCSFLDDIVHCDYPEVLDISPTVDTDESVNSPTLDGSHKGGFKPSRKSARILNISGDNLQRKVVPIGPRFQVDVPEWSDLVDKSTLLIAYNYNPDNSKRLGTRVWPIEIENLKTTTGREIGNGRPNSCYCVSPGSIDCNKGHIFVKRVLLKCDIGPAFFSWKFDEMGEEVSKSWTRKDKNTFDSLFKRRPLPNVKSFVRSALKCLAHKSWKDFVSYYFNVYIPHRMSVQTRLSSAVDIDTDDETEVEDFNYLGYQKRLEGGKLTKNTSSKGAKC